MQICRVVLSTALAVLLLAGPVTEVPAVAQTSSSQQWIELFKTSNGSVLSIQPKDVGAARIGKDVWIKRVNPDGSWALDRHAVDCQRDLYDIRQEISYDRAGNVTSSYNEPDFQHNWTGVAPGTGAAILEQYACYVAAR